MPLHGPLKMLAGIAASGGGLASDLLASPGGGASLLIAGLATGVVLLSWRRDRGGREKNRGAQAGPGAAQWAFVREVIDAMPEAAVVVDGEADLLVAANGAAAALLGGRGAVAAGGSHSGLYPQDFQTRVRQMVSSSSMGRTERTRTLMRVHPGESIPVEVATSPLGALGKRMALVVFKDLRHDIHAQQGLRETEARYQALIDGVPVAVVEKDYAEACSWLDGLRARGVQDLRAHLQGRPGEFEEQYGRAKVVSANRMAAQRLGLGVAGEPKPEADWLLREVFKLELEALWAGRASMTCMLDGREGTGSGGHMLLHWSAPVLEGWKDRRRGLLVFSDLTELRNAEELLRISEERPRLALQGFNVGIWEFNYETGRSYYSERWKTMLGYEAHEVGETRDEWFSRVHPEDREHVECALESHIRGDTSFYESEHRVLCKDGGYKWVLSRGQAYFNKQGRPARLVGAHADISERKQAEEALRSSEERLRQIIRHAGCMLWQARVTQEEGALIWRFHVPASGLHRQLFGRDGRDDEPLLWERAMVPELPEMEVRSAQAIRGGQSGYRHEFQVRVGRETLHVSERVEISRVGPDEWMLVGVVMDVTSRRRAEEALRQSEARYRQLVEHSPLAILEMDMAGDEAWMKELRAKGVEDLQAYLERDRDALRDERLTSRLRGMNNAALALLKAAAREEVTRHFHAIVSQDMAQLRVQSLVAMWSGRLETEGETTLRTFDGSRVRVVYHWWVPVVDGRPNFLRAQLILVDLSDIVRAEGALAEERERLSVTLRSMSEGVITADTQGRVQYLNPAAEALLGWSGEESVGRSLGEVCDLVNEQTRAEVALPDLETLSRQREADLPTQTALRGRDGRLCLVEGRIASLQSGEGGVLGSVLVLRDRSERARLEAEQLRSSKLESLGLLAGGIAHDFNNLLTVVMGNLTLAMLDSQAMAAAGRWLREAERGVLRARDLTQQLLTFAKGGDPVRQAVSMAEIVRETAEFALHGSKTRCVFEFGEPLWPAEADKVQIGQVVQNIVINANQAMPEGGLLRISLSNTVVPDGAGERPGPGNYLKLSIADTGTGIRPENLARIFDPYFTTKPQGSGLGLATVYSIVRKHRGQIDVESELGVGTTFHIWLPAAKSRPRQELPERGVRGVRTARILFMDDEEPIRRLGQALLQSLGYDSRVVADGDEVLREYELAVQAGRPFDLVILDLTVAGGMGGLAALKALRARHPEAKAIVTSGYSSDPVLGSYRDHGFQGVVPKPYRIGDLSRTIQEVLTGDE